MTGLLNNYSANIIGYGGNSEFPSTGTSEPNSSTFKSDSSGGANPPFHSGGFGSQSGTQTSPFTGSNNMGFFNIQPPSGGGSPFPPSPPPGGGGQPGMVPPPPTGMAPPSIAQTQQHQFQSNPGTQGMLNAQQQALMAQLGHGAMPGMPNQTSAVSQNAPQIAMQPRRMPQFM